MSLPYKNPEQKRQWSQEWKERSKENGYNKALYKRRKLRWENEDGLRAAISDAVVGLKRAHGDELIEKRVILELEEALQKYPVIKGTPLDFVQDPGQDKGEDNERNNSKKERSARKD